MPKSATTAPARRKTVALDLARDGAMGGALALLLGVWLYTTNHIIREVALMGGSGTLLTLVLAFVAEFAVGAALSGIVFRMLSQRK